MKLTCSIFPKFYQHLSLDELAEVVRGVGLDTTNLVVRDGYWCSKATLAKDVPTFVSTMKKHGMDVRFATAMFSADEVFADESLLSILSDNGITEYRMDYFRMTNNDPRKSWIDARARMEKLAQVCQRRNIRAVYQVHNGTLIPSASAAYHLVKELPSRWIGVELDPGNQAREGFESWMQSALLLKEYLVALGVKDVAVIRDPAGALRPDKGWRKDWAPLDEGVTNWHDVVAALKTIEFSGTLVWMPFYDEKDPQEMTRKLRREVAYLRRVIASVAPASTGG
jgi:sugar phosphate isomerase/epimerase